MKRRPSAYREYSSPLRSPRVMMRRFYAGVLLGLLVVAGVFAAGYVVRRVWASRAAVRLAQLELNRSVPAFHGFRLERLKRTASEIPMADLYAPSGALVGTVTIHSATHFAVSLTGGEWRYRPASNAEVERLVGEPPSATDENLARIARHSLGALSRLWPGLPARSVRVDKIETLTATADRVTTSFALTFQDRRLGVAIELDMRQRRLLFVELHTSTL